MQRKVKRLGPIEISLHYHYDLVVLTIVDYKNEHKTICHVTD